MDEDLEAETGEVHEPDPFGVPPSVERRWTRRLAWAALVMAAIWSALLVGLIARHETSTQERAEAIRSKVQVEAHRCAGVIRGQIKSAQEAAARLAGLPAGPPDPAALTAEMKRLVDPVEVLVLPTDGSDGLRVFREPEGRDIVQVVSGPAREAAVAEMAEPGWGEPGLEPQHLTTSVALVAHGAHQRVRVRLELQQVQDDVFGLRSGEAGFGFLASASGHLMVHPVRDVMRRLSSFADLARQPGGHHLLSGVAFERFVDEKGLILGLVDESTRDRSIWYERIPETNWILGVVFAERTADDISAEGVHRLWTTTLGCFVLVSLWTAWTLFGFHGDTWRLWRGVVGVTLLLALAVAAVWRLVLLGQLADPVSHTVRLTDQATVADYRHEQDRGSKEAGLPRPAYIPTGVFLQSLEFVSANNIYVRGYVWQKFTKGRHDGVSRGVLFPEGNDLKLTEAYRQETEDYELIGWQFGGVVRESFDFTGYPLDRAVAWLRLWPKDFYKNVVLVPDLAAYDMMRPSLMPGVERELVLSGWHRESSFFDYHFNSYNANFGMTDFVGQLDYPELYFNVVLRREFVQAFLIDLVPIFVITTLLFAVLVTTTAIRERAVLFDHDATWVLSTSSGLLFATLLAHTKLRSHFAAQSGIMYLEFFYFALYLLLMMVPINAFLVASGSLPAALRYRDGVIPKLLFWPAVLSFDLAVTLWFFH